MSDLDTNNYFNTVRFCARGVRHVGRENLGESGFYCNPSNVSRIEFNMAGG